MTYTIEKGIPLQKYGSRFPLADMEVGDSFRFEWDEAIRDNVRSTAYQRWGSERKFSTRSVYEDGQQWYRIWRVK